MAGPTQHPMFAAMAEQKQARSLDEAVTAVRTPSTVVMVLGALNLLLVLGLWAAGRGAAEALFDPILLLVVGLSIRAYRSRFLAVGLLLYSLVPTTALVLAVTGIYRVPGVGGGGFVLLISAILCVRATFRAAAAEGLRVVWKGVIINSLVCLAYLGLGFIVSVVVIAVLLGDEAAIDAHAGAIGACMMAGTLAIIALVALQRLPFTRRPTGTSEAAPPLAEVF